jgi:AmmeMemoRadiSam system protein A
MSWSELNTAERDALLSLARAAIEKGLCGEELPVAAEEYPQRLRAPGASFVTLEVDAELRGCIGSLTARQPLVVDVAVNARSAAFRDPRFPALTWREFRRLDIHLSLLSAPEPMTVGSEEELLAQLRPGVDGLILEEGFHRGTFLPAVWEQLPDPREFVRQLKRKAGFPADYWSVKLVIQRYSAESIP